MAGKLKCRISNSRVDEWYFYQDSMTSIMPSVLGMGWGRKKRLTEEEQKVIDDLNAFNQGIWEENQIQLLFMNGKG